MGVDHLGREGELKVLDLRGQVELVLGHPRRLASEHEVQCGAQGKHVNAFVFGKVNGRVGEEQLGSHEGRRAAKGHLLIRGGKDRGAEIRNLHNAIGGQQHILRLDISVNNSFTVEVAHATQNVPEVLARQDDIHRLALLSIRHQWPAFHVLLNQKDLAGILVVNHFVQVDNVHVLQTLHDGDLLLDGAGGVVVPTGLRPGNHLHSVLFTGFLVLAEIHFTERTLAELLLDDVFVDHTAA
mmetsp:Transcript_44218/g.77097  ORF Transcript_44218/g.77097 Transcript_44218/m.77097 type:complete len:240 (+) Transcript_44218:762-1481(+)